MPRDGAGIYTQPFPDVAPDTTIESTVYNGFVADVVQDMNTPRPIIAGGTGATNAEEAMAALKGEIAAYAVTNFDSHIWFPGSFRAASTATGGPVAAHAFAGSVVINEPLAYPPTNQNVLVEAYDLDDTGTPPGRYIRQKKAGVWGGWMKDSAFSTTGGAVGAPFALADLFFGTRVAAVGPPVTLNRFVWNDKADATGTDIATLSETGVPLLATDLVTKQYASPLDAMAFNGMQINGGFSISQERGVSGFNGTGYFCDQWYVFAAGTASIGSYVQNAAPFSGLPFYGLSGVNPAQAVLAAGDCYGWSQFIEGYRTSRLAWGGGGVNAQPITIGFYCAHHRPGLYSVAVRNAANNRSYVATYTQNVADAAEYKTITVPGDSAGTWATTTAIGLTLTFTIASGATYTAAAPNVWTNGNFFAAPGQVNAVASTADSFKISGVTVLPGTHAPPAAYAMLLTRPDTEELFKCQRYYFKSPSDGFDTPLFVYSSGNTCFTLYNFAQAMRVAPSMAGWNAGDLNLIQSPGGNQYTTNIVYTPKSQSCVMQLAGGIIAVTAGHSGVVRWAWYGAAGFYASARF